MTSMSAETEWPSGLMRCNKNRKAPGSNPTWRSAGHRETTRYEAPGDPRVENVIRSD